MNLDSFLPWGTNHIDISGISSCFPQWWYIRIVPNSWTSENVCSGWLSGKTPCNLDKPCPRTPRWTSRRARPTRCRRSSSLGSKCDWDPWADDGPSRFKLQHELESTNGFSHEVGICNLKEALKFLLRGERKNPPWEKKAGFFHCIWKPRCTHKTVIPHLQEMYFQN